MYYITYKPVIMSTTCCRWYSTNYMLYIWYFTNHYINNMLQVVLNQSSCQLHAAAGTQPATFYWWYSTSQHINHILQVVLNRHNELIH